MNKAVYTYLLATYGRSMGLWVGMGAALVEAFVVRVYTVIVMAQVATNIAAGDLQAAKHHVFIYLITYIIGGLIGLAGELIAISGENECYETLELSFYKKLVGKDLSFYRDHQTGYLVTAFRQHLDSAMLLVRFWRGEVLGTVMSLSVPAVVLLVVAPTVGLIAVAVIAVQLIYVVWSSAKANHYRDRSHEIYRQVTGEVSDQITNIVAFKSGGIEQQAHHRLQHMVKQETAMFWMRRKTTALLDLPRSLFTGMGVAAAVYFVIQGANGSDPQSLGLIVMALTYMFQIVRNIASLPNLITNHDDLVTKLYPTLEYLHTNHETIKDPPKPAKLTITKAAIDIQNIGFGYQSHAKRHVMIPVFKNLTIHIAGGEQVGIVGLSGAGKSTLANLLLRFDDIESGSIAIDGIDIRSIQQSELRQSIAYVPQEPLLFHRSIRENIAYYNNAASQAAIERAAKAAHAHEFIQKLPDGYDTMVGERGIKLSGGQKQRIAIARAVLKKAPIMLFDEATSALDSESEQIIQRALPQILGKQTAIVIAHRLSTIAGLDRILVMHEGNIIEEGTHTQLLKKRGRYYSLWQKQTNSTG